jgi:hypothetical protein
MALDFPASPTVGQTFTGGLANAAWTWDGTKWAAGTNPGFTNNAGRNALHNPGFNVQQRGPGPWASGMTADRWLLQGATTGGSVLGQVSPMTASTAAAFSDEYAKFNFGATITAGTGAGDAVGLQQNIEDVRRLSGKTVTLSFWAWCNSGTPKVAPELAQVFGSGGSPSAFVSVPGGAITINTTPTRYSVTLTLPSVSAKIIGTTAGTDYTALTIWLSVGTNNASRASGIGQQSGTFLFWGMQLEVGAQATPLEKPDPQQDLAKCQRFYQTAHFGIRGYYPSAEYLIYNVVFPVTMRVAPTITWGTASSIVNVTGPGVDAVYPEALRVVVPTVGAGSADYKNTYMASADL